MTYSNAGNNPGATTGWFEGGSGQDIQLLALGEGPDATGGTLSGGHGTLQRVTGGVTPTALTVEKANTRSPADASQATASWITNPSATGNPLVIPHVGLSRARNYRWRPPRNELMLSDAVLVRFNSAASTTHVRQVLWEQQLSRAKLTRKLKRAPRRNGRWHWRQEQVLYHRDDTATAYEIRAQHSDVWGCAVEDARNLQRRIGPSRNTQLLPSTWWDLGQATHLGAGTSVTITLTGSVDVGQHVIVLAQGNQTASAPTISDSKGNAWQIDYTLTSSSSAPLAASSKLTTPLLAGDTITVTWSASQGYVFAGAIAAQLASSSWFDQGITANGTSATCSGTTGTLAQSAELVIGFGRFTGSTSLTPVLSAYEAGWDVVGSDVVLFLSAAGYEVAREAIVTTSTAAQTPTFALTGSVGWRQFVFAYKFPSTTAPVGGGMSMLWTDDVSVGGSDALAYKLIAAVGGSDALAYTIRSIVGASAAQPWTDLEVAGAATLWAGDDFDRTAVSNGWGTADIRGGAWSRQNGVNSEFATSGHDASIATSATNGQRVMALNDVNATDVDITARFRVNVLPAGADSYIGVCARYVGSSNCYRAHVRWTAAGAIQCYVDKVVGGTTTFIATPQVYASGIANSYYWIRLRIIGTHVQSRLWLDGTSEPTSWQVDVTDTSLASGAVAVRGFHNTGSTNTPTFTLDDFQAAEPVEPSLVQSWTVNAPVGSSLSAPSTVLRLVGSSLGQPSTLRTILGRSTGLPYALLTTLGSSLGQAWTLSQLVGGSLGEPYTVAGLVSKSQLMRFTDLRVVGGSLALPWVETILSGGSLTEPYVVLRAVGASSGEAYTVTTAVGRSLTQSWNVIGPAWRSLSLPYTVRQVLGSSLGQGWQERNPVADATFVQRVGSAINQGGGNAATFAVPAGVSCARGNTLLLACVANDPTTTVIGVVDSRGNSYTVDHVKASATRLNVGVVRGFLASGLVTGDTITVTWANTSANKRGLVVGEWAGLLAPLDGTPADLATDGLGTTTTVSASAPGGTLAQTSNVYFAAIGAFIGSATTQTLTAGPLFHALAGVTSTQPTQNVSVDGEYLLSSGTSPIAVGATLASGTEYAVAAVYYRTRGLSRVLHYLVNQPQGASLGQGYQVRMFSGQSLAMNYIASAPVSRSLGEPYTVSSIVGQSLGEQWKLIAPIGSSLGEPYVVRTASGRSLTALWNIGGQAGASLGQAWTDYLTLGSSLGQPWTIKILRNNRLVMKYTVIQPLGLSLPMAYGIPGRAGNSLALAWQELNVQGRSLGEGWTIFAPTGGSLAEPYVVLVPRGQSLAEPYRVIAPIGRSLALPWAIGSALGRSLVGLWTDRALLARSFPQSYQILVYSGRSLALPYTLEVPVGASLAESYALLGIAGKSQLIRFTDLRAVGGSLALPFVDKMVSGRSLGEPYAILRAVGASSAEPYNVLAIRGASEALSWRDRVLVARSLPMNWSAAGAVGRSLAMAFVDQAHVGSTIGGAWAILNLVSRGVLLPYRLSQLVGRSLPEPFAIRLGGVGASAALTWLDRIAVGGSCSQAYRLTISVGRSLTGSWNLRSLRARSLGLTYGIRTIIGASLPQPFRVIGAVGASLGMRWGNSGPVGTSLAQRWRLQTTIGRSLDQPYVLRGLPVGQSVEMVWKLAPTGVSSRTAVLRIRPTTAVFTGIATTVRVRVP